MLLAKCQKSPETGIPALETRLADAESEKDAGDVMILTMLLCDVYVLTCGDGVAALRLAERLLDFEESEANLLRKSAALRLLGDIEGAEEWRAMSVAKRDGST
jgi:hypothetical protein